MSKTSYEKVVDAWKHGNSAREKTIRTDGLTLFSYDLKIGHTEPNGDKVVFDYTKDGGNFVSQTTSTQVGEAKKVADRVISMCVRSEKPKSKKKTSGILKTSMKRKEEETEFFWWTLKAELFDSDNDLEDTDLEHIAESIENGYTSGELVSGRNEERGWWSIEFTATPNEYALARIGNQIKEGNTTGQNWN